MSIKVVSFAVCPFVQRILIVLLEKKQKFEIKHIDLKNPPQWFLDISPTSKVPVIQVDGKVLFESAIINEYLDETYPPSLHPKDLIQKARNRAWIEFASEINFNFYRWYNSDNQTEYDKNYNAMQKNLKILEKNLESDRFNGKYFNDNNFMLVDAAYAPFFMRLQIVSAEMHLLYLDKLPNCQKWAKNLLKRPSVQKSVDSEFKKLFLTYLKGTGGLLSERLNH